MKPLRRNRDFVLLQAGQLLSAAGSESVGVVYPLLVLGLTNSPAKAGFVAFVRYLPMALLSLPAGILVDRADRKRLMITADVVRAIAAGGLVAAIAADALAYWQILVVAAVEGSAWALFSPAAGAALRSVVPLGQLPDAAGVQQARTAMVSLAGPPLGGALLALGKALPFAVNALSYLASTISLALMHTPFQEQRERDSQPLRAQLAEGARFLFATRPLDIDEAAAALLDAEAQALLGAANARLAALAKWDLASVEGAIREIADSAGVKLGKLAQPLRAALTGRTTSPGIFDVLVLLGREESLSRIADQMVEPNE